MTFGIESEARERLRETQRKEKGRGRCAARVFVSQPASGRLRRLCRERLLCQPLRFSRPILASTDFQGACCTSTSSSPPADSHHEADISARKAHCEPFSLLGDAGVVVLNLDCFHLARGPPWLQVPRRPQPDRGGHQNDVGCSVPYWQQEVRDCHVIIRLEAERRWCALALSFTRRSSLNRCIPTTRH